MSNSKAVQKRICIKGVDKLSLFGFQDNNLRRLEDRFDAKIIARGSDLLLEGKSASVAGVEKAIDELIRLVMREQAITERDLETVIEAIDGAPPDSGAKPDEQDTVILYTKDGSIRPKSPGQNMFYRASLDNDIVFVIGPAGTGKTFVAVATAVAALRDKLVKRIVLTRPAVEAGERLGFLPGDFKEKIDPYLRPLYDALEEMIPADKLKRFLEGRVIEIVPLAYMRGRTLNNSFVILDEAQNTSFRQMKMLLTRLGVNSRAIITGDVTQIDLPDSNASGLVQIQSILANIDGIAFVHLTERDVVRHRLVRDIIKAYDVHENKRNNLNKQD